MMAELLFQASALSGRYTMKVSMLTNIKRPNKTLLKKDKAFFFFFFYLCHYYTVGRELKTLKRRQREIMLAENGNVRRG